MGNIIPGEMGIDGFRGIARSGYLPNASDISSNALFNEYFFQFDESEDTEKLLDTNSYGARLKDPLSEEQENFLGISLTSCLDGKNQRETLNLVICLDISGSMRYSIDYNWSNDNDSKGVKNKMEISKEIITKIIKRLKPNERIGVVIFDHNVTVVHDLSLISETNVDELVNNVSKIKERGGTNMEGGLFKAIEMLKNMKKSKDENTNRILFMTDGEPHIGEENEEILLEVLTREAALENEIYCTHVGIGVRFDEVLVKKLNCIKGVNYFTTQSNSQLFRILDTDFNYIITPIIFNVDLSVETEDYYIRGIYGTANDDLENEKVESGQDGKDKKKVRSGIFNLMKIDSILAGQKDERGQNGGIVLLKLEEKPMLINPKKKKTIKLHLEYENLKGEKFSVEDEIDFVSVFPQNNEQKEEEEESEGEKDDYYPNKGIQKAVLLSKYNDFVRSIINSVHHQNKLNDEDRKHLTVESSFHGVTFRISEKQKEEILYFKENYFTPQMKELDDPSLSKEIEILDRFLLTEEFKSKIEEEKSLRKEIEERMISGIQDPTKFMFGQRCKFSESVVNKTGAGLKGITKEDILKGTYYCDGKCNYSIPTSIEIVFSFDVTGSMTSYISEVRKNLKSIVKTLLQDIPTIRIGIIAHSDYCDHARPYSLKKLDLTNHLPTLTQFIEICTNGCGGDGDENYEQVLTEVQNLSWDKNSSSKVLVMIGDASPHPKDSYFGIDWRKEVQNCKDMGIKCYGIKCGNYGGSCGFYQEIADVSGGKKLNLSHFRDMVEVFMGLCYREDSEIQMIKKSEKLIDQSKNENENEKYLICLDDVGGRIDCLSKDDLINIHNALHDPKIDAIKVMDGKLSFNVFKGNAGLRYTRIFDIMFMEQVFDISHGSNELKELTKLLMSGGNRKISWISISGEYGYIMENN